MIDLEIEVQRLKFCRETYPQTAMLEYLSFHGLLTIPNKFGGWDNFREFMVLSGYNRKYSHKLLKNLIDRYDWGMATHLKIYGKGKGTD